MNELSLFTGIGGGLLGTHHLLGWHTIGAVEHDEYCCKVLRRRQLDGCLGEFPILNMDVRDVSKHTVDSLASRWYHSRNILEDIDMAAHRKNYDEAVRLYDSGLSIGDVAEFYNITRQAMHAILKRRGVNFRDQQKQGKDNHFYRGGKRASDRAQNLVERAVEKGVLQRKTHCSECGDTGLFKDGRSKIQAHHDDYNKPLEVRWLCQPCHHEWHKNNKAIKIEEDNVEAGEIIDMITAGFP